MFVPIGPFRISISLVENQDDSSTSDIWPPSENNHEKSHTKQNIDFPVGVVDEYGEFCAKCGSGVRAL